MGDTISGGLWDYSRIDRSIRGPRNAVATTLPTPVIVLVTHAVDVHSESIAHLTCVTVGHANSHTRETTSVGNHSLDFLAITGRHAGNVS